MTLSRATLPIEFLDKTSAKMLRAPEPKYFYANMLFLASAAFQWQQMGNTIEFAGKGVDGQGAGIPNFESFQLALRNPAMAEGILYVEDLEGPGQGHTVKINRPVFSGGGYSEAARTVAASQTITTTPVDMTSEQISLTLKYLAGPYDTVNSRVAPYAVNAEDAKRSIHNLVNLVGLHMQRDYYKTMDTIVAALYANGSVVVYPGDSNFAITSDASAWVSGDVGTRPMDLDTIFRMEQKANDASVPTFANGRRALVVDPLQLRQLKQDPDYVKLAVFSPEANPLLGGYEGTIGGTCDIYQSVTNPQDTTTVSGVTCHKGVLFGPGAVAAAVGTPVHTEVDSNTNYNRNFPIIWAAVLATAVADNRFMIACHTN